MGPLRPGGLCSGPKTGRETSHPPLLAQRLLTGDRARCPSAGVRAERPGAPRGPGAESSPGDGGVPSLPWLLRDPGGSLPPLTCEMGHQGA